MEQKSIDLVSNEVMSESLAKEKKKPVFLLTKEGYKELKGILDFSKFRQMPYKQVSEATKEVSYLSAFYPL